MSSLREEITNEFDNCMGFHEGIKVPDYEKGYRSIDYADQVLKLIEKRIDEYIHEYEIRTYDLEDLGEDIETKKTLIKYETCKELKKELLK